jgi:two-component system invasion response regulator UvrY
VPRILVVDDHAVFRRRVIRALAESFPRTDVDEATDGRQALALVKKGTYAVVLLDISMPDKGGLEVLREIRSRHPRLPVLILTMHPEEAYAARAFRSGATGYLNKGRAAEELAGAIRTVMAGARYASASPKGDDKTMGAADGTQ